MADVRRFTIAMVMMYAVSVTAGALPVRVPAEWEPHAATWMQWPGVWEASVRPAFARIIDVVQTASSSMRSTVVAGHDDG